MWDFIKWILILYLLFHLGWFGWIIIFLLFLGYGLPFIMEVIGKIDSASSPQVDNNNSSSNVRGENFDFVSRLSQEFKNYNYSGLEALASVLASASIHVAKVDGVISEEEISAIRFRITKEFSRDVEQEKIAKVVSLTKTHLAQIGVNKIYDSLIELIQSYLRFLDNLDSEVQESLATLIFTLMYEVAIADGGIDQSEERLFSRLCSYFSISSESLEVIKRTAFYKYQVRKNETTKPDESVRFKESITFFGLSVDYSKEDLEKAWRKIAAIHHPDRFHNSNPELRELATKKFQEVQDVYQYLKEYLDKPRPKIKEDKASSISSDIELRLKKLETLRAKGLVSEEEYKIKREEILKDI